MGTKQKILAAWSAKSRAGIMATAVAVASASAVHASDLYWDADGTVAANGGSGSWLGTSLWATDPGGTSHVTWNNVNNDNAHLPQPVAASTITLTGPVSANSIEYNQSSLGYTIQGTSAANTLTIGGGGIVMSNGSNASQFINANLAGGNVNILKNSASGVTNIVRLMSANSFTGDLNISSTFPLNAGQFIRVSIDVPGALPATSQQINLNTSGAQISAGSFDVANPVVVSTGQINLNNAGGDYYLGAFANTAAGYNILQINGPITGSGNVNFQTGGGGGGGVVKLMSQSTYSGQTYFNTGATGGPGGINRGWVVWGTNNALPTNTTINIGGSGSNLTFGTGALDLAGFSQSVASFGTTPGNTGNSAGLTNTGSTQSVLTITGGDTRVMNAPIGVTASGVAISPGGPNPSNISLVLANTHTGTLILNNATAGNSGNTYSGATLVHGGTLLINGWNSSTTATATVDNGAALGGSGTYAGSITVGNASTGGHLVPGSAGGSAGNLTVGSLALASNSLLDYELGTPGSSDLTTITGIGGLSITGGAVNIIPLAGFGVGQYRLLDYNTSFVGSAGNLTIGSAPGGLVYTFIDNHATTSIDLVVSSVPEPAALACVMALAPLLLRRRRAHNTADYCGTVVS